MNGHRPFASAEFVLTISACLGSCLVLSPDAFAQTQVPRLDLSLVLRDVGPSLTLTDVQTGGVVDAVAGRTYRVELRYRIAMLDSGTTYSRGLSSARLRITADVGTNSLRRVPLTVGQDDQGLQATPANNGAQNPDTTGPGPGSSGLIGVFRGGLFDDNSAANGVPIANGLEILPLALSSPGHPSYANTFFCTGPNCNLATWGLYAFEYTFDGRPVTISASTTPDPIAGQYFAYYIRNGTTNNPVPQPGSSSTDASIRFVPTPSALVVLGGLGLPIVRRRNRGAVIRS